MIKLIAIDLDGTLLNDIVYVSEHNASAIKKAAATGIKVVVCTGRAYHEIPKSVFEIPEFEYFITSNGASITNRDSEIIYTNPMPKEVCDIAINTISRSVCLLDLYIDNNAYMQKSQTKEIANFNMPEGAEEHIIDYRILVDDIKKFYHEANKPVEKINLFFANAEERTKMVEKLSKIEPLPQMAFSMGNNLEITSNTCDKGRGLEYLCQYLDVDTSELMTIGDSSNDISMLKLAKYSVAMGNSPDYVKSEAAYITDDCKNDGVAAAIEKIVLTDEVEIK